jgi:hypothetical protein
MSAQIECPICMDPIEFNKNCVTTECGHCFHASCLMKSVAHNGFGCPYCRTTMAEEPEDDDDDLTDDSEEEEEMFDDSALRGFRFFFNNLDGEEHDAEDVEEEEEEIALQPEENDDSNVSVPTTDFVAQRLREEGVTFEQLVNMICNLDHEEFCEDERAERFNDELFGKIRVIVSNYQPGQEEQPRQAEQPRQIEPIPVVHNVPEFTFELPPQSVTVRATSR